MVEPESSGNWGVGVASVPTGTIAAEITELHREIASLDFRIEALDTELAPVTRLEFDIKDQIRRTHGGRPGIDPIKFDRMGAEQRRPMFERLTQLAVQFGKVKASRSELRSLLKAYQKRVEVLTGEMERERKRAMKNPKTKVVKTKHEILGELLHDFGTGKIDRDRFWRAMNAKGYTQNDIDNWLRDDANKQGTLLV